MNCNGKCELVQFKVESAHLVHIDPRPRPGAPQDLELKLTEEVKNAVESDSHDCTDGCDCVIGEPVEVSSREQYKHVTHGEYNGWFRIKLVKYRTGGECMPATDPLPAGSRT